uniref:Synaptopodin 2 n=1 Tax=Astyanax mexicanus TaxID=7994 RepID=A0A8B9K7U7_ASTMX
TAVEDGSHAYFTGLREDDEIMSVNGQLCSSLSLSEVVALIQASNDGLELLVKRYLIVELEAESPGRSPKVRTQFCIPAPKDRIGANPQISGGGGGTRLEITPGSVVELQLSLSQTTLEDVGCTSLGSARGFEGELYQKKITEEDSTTTSSAPGCTFYIPRHEREPLGQRGVLISASAALRGQVEVTTQSTGRGSGGERVGSGETEAKASDQPVDYGEGEGGRTEEAPTSSCISFGIPSEEGDSESERELNQPNKHRARHARLRRSESLSEKQVKEAKSKCKRIALLLTAAAPNPNNKGVLMFKKHRQRAKQYTLVSYGTGENEPEFQDEEDEDDDNKETHAVEFTVLATSETELDEDFFTNPPGHKSIVTFDWDTGLLEIERKLQNPEDMNALPETKGKGALMFAQRKQRMDEIAAEHEELRSKGIPVEGIQEAEKRYQQQVQQYAQHVNGMSSQTNAMQSSVMNRSAKPFSVQNQAAAPFTPPSSQEQPCYSAGQGEQIASRDERISVPAIKTGILQDTRWKNKAKPMFTFKESPKVSPNPELLNLLNRGDRKAGFESGPEEDYLSLGAEACNFLQSPKVKHKIPPPVAPKPHINPASPPWSPQPEIPSQQFPHTWAPRPQQGPVSNTAPAEPQKLPPSAKPWSPPQTTQPRPLQRMGSYTIGTKVPSPTPTSRTISPTGMGSAFEMPALRGKGAELFAKRQSRMEKYVVDAETVQANKARPSSPSPSLPTTWKYSPNCRAPPPLAYNPLQCPTYPPGAIKQPPSSSPSIKNKNKNKEKEKPAPKPLHVLDVMKHQPYQLDSSLFTYGPAAEKLAAEREAAEKLEAQRVAEAQAQAQAQQAPSPPYHYQPASNSYVAPTLSPLGINSRSASVSPSPRPSSHATYTSQSRERQVFRLEKGRKPPTPWEAASRHPLGLVDEAFAFQDMQQSIASSLRSAAQRKLLPEPPADWKAKVSYEPPAKSQGWSASRSPLSFLSPTKSTASIDSLLMSMDLECY